jgi:2-dehydro-3-deoxyphosphogluconate aldolase / (4S)-4-hydroxy-2-oxoglutarate aldolase
MSSDKHEILKRIESPGIIPVIRMNSTDKVFKLLEALLQGGVSCAELTMTIPNALQVLCECRKVMGEKLAIGMGTVTGERQAELAIECGAQFLVSPTLAFNALKTAQRHEIPFAMGAFSPTEILQAHEAGADYIKIFPLNCLGIRYIKDVRGPFPEVKFIPTGGISLDQVSSIIKHGASAMGVGGELVERKLVEEDNWRAITERAKLFVEAALEAKQTMREIIQDDSVEGQTKF